MMTRSTGGGVESPGASFGMQKITVSAQINAIFKIKSTIE